MPKPTPEPPAIVWFRQDLRLGDNPALAAAAASGRELIFVYVLDDETPGRWRIGAAARWWLHQSLAALSVDLAAHGGRLVLRRGDAEGAVGAVAAESGAAAVYWNRVYEPAATARDARIKHALKAAGVEAHSYNGALLFEPWEIRTRTGEPFKVFTPFWRACLNAEMRAPAPAPCALRASRAALASDALAAWRLTPTAPNWAAGFGARWLPGEAGAHAALQRFASQRLDRYADARDALGEEATSRLSPHLHWGEVSPVQARAAVEAAIVERPGLRRGGDKFLSELGWREFSYHLLYNWPTLPEQNWRESFNRFPWREDEAQFHAWSRGRTGYPLVDAAMRELWATGYMHNRARMVAGSFLVKHLLIDWRRGADWFWDTLLDADLANNSASWQWVAGSGADAAPFFRIFNPVAQGERFDADGAYVRRWAPELARLPDGLLHQPWNADAGALAAAGITLGRDYPHPIVDHAAARARALEAFARLSSAN